jgi:hypothetical protein
LLNDAIQALDLGEILLETRPRLALPARSKWIRLRREERRRIRLTLACSLARRILARATYTQHTAPSEST